jgi:peptide/nickel transport system permease protein
MAVDEPAGTIAAQPGGSALAPGGGDPVGGFPINAGTMRVKQGGFRDLMRRTIRFRQSKIGLALALFVVLIAVLGPLLSPHNPAAILGAPYQAPSSTFIFGTDNIGRDVLSRFLHGGFDIFWLALAATIVGVGSGTIFGLIAGYRRGARAQIIMRTLDVVLSFPPLLLALLFMSLLGVKWWLLLLLVGISHTPYVARVIESATFAVTGRGYVQYNEMIGTSRWRILTGEILPQVMAPLTVQMGLRLTYSIGTIVSLDYLGFGPQPPAVDWGQMINDNQSNLVARPLPVLVPIAAVAILTVGVNLLSDGFGRAAGIDLGKADA